MSWLLIFSLKKKKKNWLLILKVASLRLDFFLFFSFF